jgi:hypothetical protein
MNACSTPSADAAKLKMSRNLGFGDGNIKTLPLMTLITLIYTDQMAHKERLNCKSVFIRGEIFLCEAEGA